MKEDKFFEGYRQAFEGFSPEVPESIYQGVRKTLKKQLFWRFSATRFNAYYLATGLALLGFFVFQNTVLDEKKPATLIEAHKVGSDAVLKIQRQIFQQDLFLNDMSIEVDKAMEHPSSASGHPVQSPQPEAQNAKADKVNNKIQEAPPLAPKEQKTEDENPAVSAAPAAADSLSMEALKEVDYHLQESIESPEETITIRLKYSKKVPTDTE